MQKFYVDSLNVGAGSLNLHLCAFFKYVLIITCLPNELNALLK